MIARLLGILLLLVLAKACKSDDSPVNTDDQVPARTDILILNEGLFRRGNASVSSYNPETKEVKNDVLTLLDNRSIDVLQSATIIQDSLLLLVSNNTNELILCRREGLEELRSFDGLGSPRYALELPDARVLITDLYAGSLLLLDLRTGMTTQLPFAKAGEAIIASDQGALIASPTSEAIYEVDVSTLNIVDSLKLGFPVSALSRGPANLILATGGAQTLTDTAKLVAIDWITKAIVKIDSYSVNEASFYPRLEVSDSMIFVLQAKLEQYSVRHGSGQLAISKISPGISVPGIAYGLGVDRNTGEYYVTDAGATFGSRGTVIRFSQGTAIDTFTVGALPNGFVF